MTLDPWVGLLRRTKAQADGVYSKKSTKLFVRSTSVGIFTHLVCLFVRKSTEQLALGEFLGHRPIQRIMRPYIFRRSQMALRGEVKTIDGHLYRRCAKYLSIGCESVSSF